MQNRGRGRIDGIVAHIVALSPAAQHVECPDYKSLGVLASSWRIEHVRLVTIQPVMGGDYDRAELQRRASAWPCTRMIMMQVRNSGKFPRLINSTLLIFRLSNASSPNLCSYSSSDNQDSWKSARLRPIPT